MNVDPEEIEELKSQLEYYKDKVSQLSQEVVKTHEADHLHYDEASIRTDITAFIDQFDWRDDNGRGYWIRCRHIDLQDDLEPKLTKLRKYHWHYDAHKHKDGFIDGDL